MIVGSQLSHAKRFDAATNDNVGVSHLATSGVNGLAAFNGANPFSNFTRIYRNAYQTSLGMPESFFEP